MSGVTRRDLARGAAWAVPTIAVAAPAPALAASACADIVPGRPLPVTAFVPAYLVVTNQTLGGAADKAITVAAGISIDSTAAGCTKAVGITLASAGATSRIKLQSGKVFDVTGGTEAAGTGVAGSPNSGCSRGSTTAQACITATGMGVANSTGTSSDDPSQMSFIQTVTVAGYGARTIYINATSFSQSGTNWNGSGLSITLSAIV